MNIRRATTIDYNQIWIIFKEIIQTGDTYVFSPETEKSELEKLWFANSMDTFVMEEEGVILGTYFIKPNQIDLGNHIANCGYMVHPDHQGRGIGAKLCAHSLEYAHDNGYKGMIFNIVVSTNRNAIKLWKKFGFDIIGTIPEGFKHSNLGYVDSFVMYRKIE